MFRVLRAYTKGNMSPVVEQTRPELTASLRKELLFVDRVASLLLSVFHWQGQCCTLEGNLYEAEGVNYHPRHELCSSFKVCCEGDASLECSYLWSSVYKENLFSFRSLGQDRQALLIDL